MRGLLLFGFAAALAVLYGAPYPCPDGAFSLDIPDGWRLARDAEEPYPVILGPEGDIDAPSVVLTAYPTPLPLHTFADESLREFSQNAAYTAVRRDAFLTANRKTGFKAVLTAQEAGVVYAQIFYFTQGVNGRHYAFMATLPAAKLPVYERALDIKMKTFCPSGETPRWKKQLNQPVDVVKKASIARETAALTRPPKKAGKRPQRF